MSLEVQFGDTVLRSTPVVGAAGVEAVTRILGLTLGDWFYISAITYTIIQAWAIIYKTLKKGDQDNE